MSRHDRDAVPQPIRFDRPVTLTDEEFQRLERRWLKRHGNAGAHKVKLLGRHPWPWWKRAYYRARRWLA
jgi:hypothetical protein